MLLRKRITVALTGVIVLFVVAQAYLAYSSLERQEDELVDEIVRAEANRLIERIAEGDTHIGAEAVRLGPNLTTWLIAGDPAAAPSLPNYLATLADGQHMLHRADRVFHSIIESLPAGRLYVQYDATDNEELVYLFGRYLLLTGVLCIVLGGLISHLLARIVVAPFRRLTEGLSNWSMGAIPDSEVRSDEETMLLKAFDQAHRRLEESLAREREFAANVRHEVRTPLAALRTDAEMLLLTGAMPAPAEKRLKRMIAEIDNAASGLDALHALSSARPGKAESVGLAACIDDVWESLGHLAAERGASFVNDVARTETVEADRHALMMVLRNLLRNALEHASPGECRVSGTSKSVIVADEGPGIPASHRPFIFDRYFRGRLVDSPGTTVKEGGLGLAIARQTADLQGWKLELESSDAGGTVFRLSFP